MSTARSQEPVRHGLATPVPHALPASIRLPATPRSAGIARGLLRSALEDHVAPEVLSDVELLAGELVANAAAALGDYCVVSVSVPEPVVVRIAVTDPDPYHPSLGTADLLAENGRGLSILATVALRWGVEPSPVGKTVWFDMPSIRP